MLVMCNLLHRKVNRIIRLLIPLQDAGSWATTFDMEDTYRLVAEMEAAKSKSLFCKVRYYDIILYADGIFSLFLTIG